jgi:catechol 2,3-dioxygenase-like lactoylglutathione lyase family enzyme
MPLFFRRIGIPFSKLDILTRFAAPLLLTSRNRRRFLPQRDHCMPLALDHGERFQIHCATTHVMATAVKAAQAGHSASAKVRHVMSHKGFSPIGLATRDLERTRHFYAHVLGCTVVRCDILKMTEGGPMRHIFFDTGRDQRLAFLEPHGVPGIPDDDDAGMHAGLGVPGSLYHFAFEAGSVAGLEAKRQELLTKGVAVTAIVDHAWAQSIYFHDPNGLSLEYCCLARDVGTEDDVTMQGRVERSVEGLRQRWDCLREAASSAGAYA